MIYLQTPTDVLRRRLRERARANPDAPALDDEYVRELNEAYNHFFFHYNATPLLVVETSQFDLSWGDEALDDLDEAARRHGARARATTCRGRSECSRRRWRIESSGRTVNALRTTAVPSPSALLISSLNGLVQEGPQADRAAGEEQPSRVPEGLWVKCPSCARGHLQQGSRGTLNVCPKCAHHFRIERGRAAARCCSTATWTEYDAGLQSTDPLKFTDTKPYRTRLEASIAATGMKDAVICADRTHRRHRDRRSRRWNTRFIGGSMGVVVGEKITRRDRARASTRRLPVVIVSCSGGARMMEGALSLMQMAKISAALARLDRARLPYISVLTDPTTGGVTASFAMLGDVNIAEPKALIGFAGPRVIEQTIRQKLPEGFQRSEFLLEHGMLDLIVDRRELKDDDRARAALRALGRRRAPVTAADRQSAAAGAGEPALPRRGREPAAPLEFLFSLERFGMKFGLANMARLLRGARPSRGRLRRRSSSPAPTARDRSPR